MNRNLLKTQFHTNLNGINISCQLGAHTFVILPMNIAYFYSELRHRDLRHKKKSSCFRTVPIQLAIANDRLAINGSSMRDRLAGSSWLMGLKSYNSFRSSSVTCPVITLSSITRLDMDNLVT